MVARLELNCRNKLLVNLPCWS